MHSSYVIGVDFGTDSVRSLLLNTSTGAQLSSHTFFYPRWKAGLYCNRSANQYRQHPLDYIEGLEHTIKACLADVSPEIRSQIKAIGIDTTGSTPCPVSAEGIPLAMLPAFAENPNAMFILWKDHTALQAAEQINAASLRFPTNYLAYVGGAYSTEWFWAKMLHISHTDHTVRDAAFTWLEHSDWMPMLLTGKKLQDVQRNICAAGHKALWSEAFNGFPPLAFFEAIDPHLKKMAAQMPGTFVTSEKSAGTISPEWAATLGLSTNVIVCNGIIDAHAGAIGAELTPYHLVKIMGTSTCDIMVVPPQDLQGKNINGICGQVMGSVLPEFVGLEAGQSAFGDIFQWYVSLLTWSIQSTGGHSTDLSSQLLSALANEAAKIPGDAHTALSIDWFNGRRTPNANQSLHGALLGLTLGSDAASIFRSLAEGACFGARAINDCFISQGIPIHGITAIGGIAKKSPYIMQMLANILQLPIRVHRSENTCAIGAAMNAATAAGIHPSVSDAIRAMGQGFEQTWQPDPAMQQSTDHRYKQYLQSGKYIETVHL
ncbi:ribulokinase [Pseudobacter ginsenosidimutans]|uniref:L-ribulokinase n=1 Tax=Pseudobacter ginsenosidimutans TaxID=661488 RepID=A0A4Q7M7B9_9BACT|nr:ribulokinase [Pseudobacter ginsenosidimutans]QEC42603.1 ribulokinase [Pseudobacter ginsenosidimutans]RZS63906.1 L-ribulokinase [Pseudobacter ginsenosidimutans]